MSEVITKKDFLLDADGKVKNCGFADNIVLKYNKDCVKNKSRLKEQDVFFISNSRFALYLAISDIGKTGILSACVVDFVKEESCFKSEKIKKDKNISILTTEAGKGVSYLKTDNAEFKFEYGDKKAHLTGMFDGFFDKITNANFFFDITVDCEKQCNFLESSAFKNQKQFCLNITSCNLTASGRFACDGKEYGLFDPGTYATYNFTRALFPHKTSIRTACFQTLTNENENLAVYLSMGPGNHEVNDKSMICHDGTVEAVDEVKIYIQKLGHRKNYMGTWTFYSGDGKVELTFEPVADNSHKVFGFCYFHNHHQVFGKYSGKITLNDGNIIEIENVLGYAENITNLF